MPSRVLARLRLRPGGPAGRAGSRSPRRSARRAAPTSARSGRPPRCCGTGWTRRTSPTTRARRCGCPASPAASPRWPPGLEPVMQMTCRDRNRIALQSDLLSAGALGVPNLLLMTGDRPERGDHADAAAVFDLDSGEPDAARPARCATRAGCCPAARSTRRRGSCSARWTPAPARPDRLARRSPTAPSSCRPSSCSTSPASRPGWPGCATAGWTGRCGILAGVGPVRSLRALEFLAGDPRRGRARTSSSRRLRGVPGDRVAAEGMAACAETVAALRELPGWPACT